MSLDPVSLGIQAALMATSMALTASHTTEGPRVTDLSVTVADYGTPLAYFRGKRRLALPIIFAEKLREVKVQSKTKGGKFNNYKYYATFAVAIAGHAIGGVTRIWADKHLIYDATGPGPQTPFSISDGFNLLESIRFYLGTEDQMPDPRMQATVEAAHGAGSCPAYRGVAYAMFEEIPVEKFGNRVPQIEIEAITDPSPAFPYETFEGQPPGLTQLTGFTFSPDFSRFFAGSDTYAIWDVATRSRIVSGTLPHSIYSNVTRIGVSNSGAIYGINNSGFKSIVGFTPDGFGYQGVVADWSGMSGTPRDQQECWVLQDGTGKEHIFTRHNVYQTFYSLTLAGGSGVVQNVPLDDTGHQFNVGAFFTDSHGDIWAAATGDHLIYLYRLVDTDVRPGSPGLLIVDPSDTPSGIVGISATHHDDHFVVCWNGTTLFAIDQDSGAITGTASPSIDPQIVSQQFANLRPGAKSIWLSNIEVSLADLSTIRTVNLLDWKVEDSDGVIYDPVNNALICGPQFADVITWRYLDRIGSSAATLGDVVDFVAGLAGIDPTHLDTSLLTATVDGWSWSQGTGKDILAPLLDLYDVDAREHGFVLAFKPRGDAAGATIDMADFVKGEQDDSPTHTVDRGQGTDIPRRLTLSFSDVAADQQTNSASVARPLDRVDGARELSIDMTPWAAHVDEARQYTERMHRRRWFGRETYTFGLTAQHVALEPGDVHLLTFDGVAKVARMTLCSPGADQVLHTEWERDDPSVAVLTGQAGAGFDGRAPSVILVATPSKGFVLDMPLIRDADNDVNPLLYYAAAPYVTGTWPGATILRSLDDGATFEEEWASVPSAAPSTWGYAAGALADADPWLWDRGNSVTITLQYGNLTGATEAECNRNPQLNLALLGAELIQFTTATLNIDASWTLSGLKRGRRGTEWACGLHAPGDAFVLLTATGRVAMGASDVGDSDVFKAVTVGRDAASAFVIPLDFTGATLKPYAPASLRAVKDPATGDWAIDWVRRTRIGGAWTGGTTIPLGEASEEYALVVLDGGGAVVRTYSGLSSPAATYDAADQASDGGDVAEGDLNLAVYQISDTVGRGFAATGTF